MRHRVFFVCRVFILLLSLFFSDAVSGADNASESVVLFRLTRCCPESAWTDAEYAVLKELDALEVTVTLLDRSDASEQSLEQDIETIGRSGDYSILLYFYKIPIKRALGVHIAIFDATPKGIETRHITYTVPPSIGAVSILTLKAVEAVREVLSGPKTAESDISPIDRPAPVKADKTPVLPPNPADLKKESSKKKDSAAPKSSISVKNKSLRRRPPIEPHRSAIGLGPSGLWSPGGAGPAFALQALGNFRIVSSLFAEINASVTLVTRDLQGGDNRASYRCALFRGAFFWSFLDSRRIHPMLGISGGLVLIVVSGMDTNELLNRTDPEIVWMVGGGGRLGIDLTKRWGLVFGVDIGLYIREVKIKLGYDDFIRIGRPLINGFSNLEFRF